MDMPEDPNNLAGLVPDKEILARDEQVVKAGFWRKVRSTLGKVPFTEDAVAAYYCATDGSTPTYVKAILMGAIAYFVTPIDVIPDFIIGFGFTDDAAVLMAAISAIRNHLKPEHRSSARDFLDGNDQPDNQSG
jgi:uncharacterized membrane protein YkvA (DUF1232 family)